MRRCLACENLFPYRSLAESCPACGIRVDIIDELPSFAPEPNRKAPGFNVDHYARLAKIEDGHFWFRARNELIVNCIRKAFPHASAMLEIGCGTGFVLQAIHRAFPEMQVSGSEIHTEGLAIAMRRLPQATLLQMDARNIPFDREYDLIGAFDVIEHIAEDEVVLGQIHSALKPGAGAIFTVPQHPWLWSAHDEAAHHVRRYRRLELDQKLRLAGFQVILSTSFVSLLLPLLAASRMRGSRRKSEADSVEFSPSPALNDILYRVLALENQLIRLGARLPFGGTRLVAAIKTG